MKKFLLLILSVFTIGLFSCQDDDNGGQDLVERTILVYIAGDGLQQYVGANLEGLVRGYGESEKVSNLLVYFEDGRSAPTLYQITRDKNGVVEKNVIRTYEEDIISTDPEVMAEILNDGFSFCPAKSYGLVMGSHGTSWIPGTSVPHSWGASKEYNINIPELANVLANIPHVYLDFILFDACYMSAVEVAYELKDVAKYIIASPTEVIGFGFPYDALVKEMFSYEEHTVYGLAEVYAEYYDGALKNSVYMEGSIAVIKTEGMRTLASVTRDILNSSEEEVWNIDRNELQRYYCLSKHNFCWDFGHFMKTLNEEKYSLLVEELDKTVIYKYATPYFGRSLYSNYLTIDPENYSGIASFIPVYDSMDDFHNYYKELAWFKAAGWEEIWFN